MKETWTLHEVDDEVHAISNLGKVITEIWKPITADDGIFVNSHQVSNLGRIKSFLTSDDGDILKPFLVGSQDQIQYYNVTLCYKGETYYRRVHRLVANEFLDEDIDGKHVHHKNHDPHFNFEFNLEVADVDEHTEVHRQAAIDRRLEKYNYLLNDLIAVYSDYSRGDKLEFSKKYNLKLSEVNQIINDLRERDIHLSTGRKPHRGITVVAVRESDGDIIKYASINHCNRCTGLSRHRIPQYIENGTETDDGYRLHYG